MSVLRTKLARGICAAVLCGIAWVPASATSYNFVADYFGNGNVVLAAGSDDPVGATFVAGDSFTYTLTGQNGVFSTTAGGSIFPFLALPIAESGRRVSDFTLTLNYLGSSVFSYGETDAPNAEVHLGTNTVTLPGSLVFDQIVLTDTIVSTEDLNGGPTTTTVTSIVPIFGTPDQTPYARGVVSYSGNTPSVPEPASWAMMVSGFALIGGTLRSRRKAVSFA
jgi:hypothetical protein